MRWNPFRRTPAHSDDDRLAERTAAAEAGLAAGRYELAHAEFAAVVDEYRALLVDRPDDPEVTDLLAARLRGLAESLEKLRRFDELAAVQDEAVRTSRRAVELRRATVTRAGDLDLARTLRTFALVRAGAGVELDEAARAVDEAAAVHMAALAAAPDEDRLSEVYATDLARARVLARQGRHVEAARVADLARTGHLDGLLDELRARRREEPAPSP